MGVRIKIERNVPYKEYDPTGGEGSKYKWTTQKIEIEVTAEKTENIPDMYVAALKGLENGQKKHNSSFKSRSSGSDFE